MPQRKTVAHARADEHAGKTASSQAGEFVREEIDDIRKGKHGARSAKQAIAIGLSKARSAGVDLKPPAAGKTSKKNAAQCGPRSRPGARRTSEAREHGSCITGRLITAGTQRRWPAFTRRALGQCPARCADEGSDAPINGRAALTGLAVAGAPPQVSASRCPQVPFATAGRGVASDVCANPARPSIGPGVEAGDCPSAASPK